MPTSSLVTLVIGLAAIVAGALLPSVSQYLIPVGTALLGLAMPQPGAKK